MTACLPIVHRVRRLGVLLLAWLAGAASAQAVQSAQAVEHLRVVGGLAGVNQYTRHEEPFWSKDFARLTGGLATAEIVPFDQAGLSGDEMLRVIQMGAIPFGTVLFSRSAAAEPELAAPDLAGLNPDFASIQRTTASYRPRLKQLLRERYGVELLALYVYPAQVVFCAKPFASLSQLAGRRVRVSSPTQGDFMLALGAVPVQTPFSQVVSSVRAGSVDCAVTGTMSGNTIGLHEVTSHVHPMAINWGLAAFVAHGERWALMDSRVRQVIERELPRLEANIWAESERETAEGLACNTGAESCKAGKKGNMKLVAATPSDERLRLALLHKAVVPAWLQRCGTSCAAQWQRSIGRHLATAAR